VIVKVSRRRKDFWLTVADSVTLKDFAPGVVSATKASFPFSETAWANSPNGIAASVAVIAAQGISARYFKYRLAIAGATR
jgi:hypothetical protein